MMMACEFGRAAVECELRTRDDHFRVTLHCRKRHQTCNCLAPLVVERNSKKLCHPRDLVRQVGGQVIIVNEEKIGPVTGLPPVPDMVSRRPQRIYLWMSGAAG